MKRILAWILIMVLLVGCAGCKENETEKEQTGSENLETATDGENKPVSVDNTDETENDDFRLTFYTDLYSEEYQELGNAQMWLSGFSEETEGNIYLDYETLNKYAEAMFPETGVYPDIKESDGIIWPESAEDSVIVKANFTVDDSTVVVRSMEVTDDRNVDITLLFKGEIEEYAVVHISPVSEVQNPFKWVITGVELAKG